MNAAGAPAATRHRRVWAAAVAGFGLALLIWLTLEDSGTLAPAGLGWSGAALIGLAPARPGRGQPAWRLLPPVTGAAVGIMAALLAALLMLFKTGWHAHAVPDYALMTIIDMAARAPAWAGAGLAIGLGALSLRGR